MAGVEVTRLDGITGKSVSGCTITDSNFHLAVQKVMSATAPPGSSSSAGRSRAEHPHRRHQRQPPGLAANARQTKLKAVEMDRARAGTAGRPAPLPRLGLAFEPAMPGVDLAHDIVFDDGPKAQVLALVAGTDDVARASRSP